jgi:hypothetical protein
MGNRRIVRQALENFLLQATGIKVVYQGIPSQEIDQFPAAIITLPEGRETRWSSGKKRIDYEPTIQIWDISMSGDGVTDELAFDDLLDSIDDQIRSDPTLGGQVFAAGVEYIHTLQPDPTSDQHELVLVAEKKLDVTLVITG